MIEPTVEERLQRLERLLAEDDSLTGDAGLAPINVPRIKSLVDELRTRSRAADVDHVDRVTMRLLLDELKSALRQLRMVASSADQTLRTCDSTFKTARRDLQRLSEGAS